MAKRRVTADSRYFPVTVDFEGGTARCTPDEVQLYYDDPKSPDSVRWSVGRLPEGATRVVIKWDVASPFIHLGVERPSKRGETMVLLGTGNVRETGIFYYSVMAVDEKGRILAGVDPRVKNEPYPPLSG